MRVHYLKNLRARETALAARARSARAKDIERDRERKERSKTSQVYSVVGMQPIMTQHFDFVEDCVVVCCSVAPIHLHV